MRHAILKVSPLIFINLCKASSWNSKISLTIARDAIPEDAEYIRSFTDDSFGWGYINLVIKSESFEDLKEGDLIPTLPSPIFEMKKE